MGQGAELISGKITNAGATLTAWTMATGDSLTVRSANPSSKVWLDDAWALGATAGALRIRSPRMHDNVQCLRTDLVAADVRPVMSEYVSEPLYPQDILIVEQSGGGAETDSGSLLVYYEDLPGVDAVLKHPEQIFPNVQHLFNIEVDLTTGASAGNYGGAAALNATFDVGEANRWYAILGYLVSTQIVSVGVKGPDTGNLRVGGPASNDRLVTRDFFVRMSQRTGRPFVPVINYANRAGTFIDAIDNGTATSVHVQLLAALLQPSFTP